MRLTLFLLLSMLGLATAAAAPANAPAAPRYAVTLLSSFEPIPDSLVPTDLSARVYRTQASVFGRTIYFVRAGFFASTGEAETARGRLLARFPAAFVTEITPGEYAAANGPARQPAPAAAASAPPPSKTPGAAREEIFAITLVTGTARAPQPSGELPESLRDSRLYVRDLSRNGKTQITLNLGFFGSAAEAEKARRLLLGKYPQARVRPANAAERDAAERTAVATAPPAPVAPTAAPTAPAASGVSAIDKQATALMTRTRDALTRGDNVLAIQLLQQLLQLPPNSESQNAQELIGLAHERNGEKAKAKREYELCLKLYPDWTGAERVRQRLADLDDPAKAPKLKATARKQADVTTVYGNLSQFYYRGDSRVDTTVVDQTDPTILTRLPTLTTQDQSALVTGLDLTGRMRRGDWDNRLVVRNNHTLNFLEGTENVNRLYAAYGEVRNKAYEYGGRLGRQPGNSGGVLGRFDGLSAGWNFLPKWRLNVVAGEPVEFTPINSDKLFWGTNLDFGTFAEHWNGNAYYISQTVDDIADREAVGAELRYFDPRRSLMLLTDYDLGYGELNIAMLQGNWQFGQATTLNVLIDHRRAPVLQTSNAVMGLTDTSIKSNLLTMTEAELRAMAEAHTPISDLQMLGVTHNFSTKWQIGGDIKRYNIGGMPASGTQAEVIGTGDVYVYTVQGIATTLFSKSDISVLSLSYIDSRDFEGQSISFNNRAILRDKWTVDLSLRYYLEQRGSGSDTERFTPILRLGYRWRENLTVEAEAGMEQNHLTNGGDTTDSTSNFYTLGYRWDF